MLNENINARSHGTAPEDASIDADAPNNEPSHDAPPGYDESIVEEIGALIEDAGLYATAEIAFQKTRAKIAGRNIGAALAFVVLAIILLHIALIAMAVGFVIALAPLVTIWGAIAIVVGVMLLSVVLLAYAAARRGQLLAQLFAASPDQAKDEA